jgi:hypothetical protein
MKDFSMAITDNEYAAHVDALLGTIAALHAQGQDVDIALCTSGLECGRREHKKVRDFACKMLKIKPAEFDRAIKIQFITQQLGEYPTNPSHFVDIITKQMHVSAKYNGTMRKDEVPYILDANGAKNFISPDLWESYDFKTMIDTTFKCAVTLSEITREMRIRAVDYGLPFSPTALNDATEKWYEMACTDRLWRISSEIDHTDDTARRTSAQASLLKLAETCFDCDYGSAFVVAVLNKFIWQVKRKIKGIEVFDHLMPVILGAQGIGKSTLVRNMLKPVEELCASTDFKAITDDRNAMLWRNFVILLDEMGWAKKAEMDTVKNILSAETLTRRIMNTTKYNTITQHATFIGTANAHELSELIRDDATRRFISLSMKIQPDRAVINGMDWKAVWQSIDERVSDPMLPFKAVLLAAQAEDRTLSPIEDWLESLSDTSIMGWDLDYNKNEAMKITRESGFTSTELFRTYQEWEKIHYRAIQGKSSNAFGREMKRLSRDSTAKFRRSLTNGNNTVFTWQANWIKRLPIRQNP